jgi:hypothetical protein
MVVAARKTYPLSKFCHEAHEIPGISNLGVTTISAGNKYIPDGLAVVRKDKVVPDHEEERVEFVKVGLFHERDFAHGGAREVVVRLAVKRTEWPREVDERPDGQNHEKQGEPAWRELWNRCGVDTVYEQIDEGLRGVKVVSAATISCLKKSKRRIRAAKEHSGAPPRTELGPQHAEGERRGFAGGS